MRSVIASTRDCRKTIRRAKEPGVYLVPVAVFRSWISGKSSEDRRFFPAGELFTEGVGANRHFGFHSLIELFTIAQPRKRDASMAKSFLFAN
jgi:hypothetical protein